MTISVVERLAKRSVQVGTCMEWTGSKTHDGYGQMRIGGVLYLTHRLAWTEAHGPIPAGMVIDHMCHNKSCVYTPHLRLATRKQNNENKAGAYRTSKSGVRGVCWDKQKCKWRVEVRHNKKAHFAGYFDDLEEAGETARQLRLKLFTFSTVDLI